MMAASVPQNAAGHLNAEETFERRKADLICALKEKEPTFAEVERLLAETRVSGQLAIFQILGAGIRDIRLRNGGPVGSPEGSDVRTPMNALKIEGGLWDAHLEINGRFRKWLSNIQEDEKRGKKRPVEKRKLLNRYSKFIKSSQEFYEEYIYHLLEDFKAYHIPEFEEVARRKGYLFEKEEPLNSAADNTLSAELRRAVLSSCHATLIRLGDLGRYYQTELVDQTKKNWERATKNYSMASLVNPDSGNPFNQFAVIALADEEHLNAVYYLYRALSAKEPHPNAHKNLTKEFKKVLSKKKGTLPTSKDLQSALVNSFVYLHAQCYQGDSPEHEERENEIMRQVTVDLKENVLEPSLLEKFALINIASESHAKDLNAQVFLQRLNVKFFFTLLQVILAELECSADKVTSVAHSILPALRHYSSWLLVNSQELVSVPEAKDSPLCIQIKELWKSYANTLTLLTSTFDVVNLPAVDYLLEEDENTLGFKPFAHESNMRRYLGPNGATKPRQLHTETSNSSNTDMLFRIREFVIDGLDLVIHERIPIVMVDKEDAKLFVYKEEGLPQFSSPRSQPRGHGHTLSSTSIDRDEIQRPTPPAPGVLEDGASISGSVSMHRMVDNLVESEPAESLADSDDGPMPSYASLNSNHRRNMVRQGFEGTLSSTQGPTPVQCYSPGPPLPSIMNTAFAPQPGEAMSPASRPSTAIPAASPQVLPSGGNNISPFPGSLGSSAFPYSSSFISTPVDEFPSSLSYMQTPRLGNAGSYINGTSFFGVQPSEYITHYDQPQLPQLLTSSPYPGSMTYPYRGNRESAMSYAGVIGEQTPPNGQCG
ncbi:uncharacterized protein GIQ15_05184 [Arthroderma uncinatum]|uniref:uncharacterized protein n=1 Tax=Arthroderma uncinatum TaxID=74035 RepID=UPI00144A8C18|nr:uncharacterized protein GIQ15_05184 [Arthroderma uncinatum]KAF3482425.1 hypothetical protein GIQ15_05184 [Arthroderma uncinatum]